MAPQETAELKARMEQLLKGPTPLEAARAKTAELQADKAKFLDHIAGLEVCLAVLSACSVACISCTALLLCHMHVVTHYQCVFHIEMARIIIGMIA